MKKKVLIIGPSYLPIPAIKGGAIETLIDNYIKHNSKTNKYDLTVYSPYSSDINCLNEYNNVEFRYIKKSIFGFKKIIYALFRKFFKNAIYPNNYCLSIIKDLKKKKELEKYDLVIVENELNSLPTYKKYIKCRIIEHLHNDYLNINTKCCKKIAKSCNELWGVSNFICKRVNEVNEELITRTLYNGIDIDKFKKKTSTKDKNHILQKLGYSSSDFIVAYCGRLIKEKGILELIRSFNQINENDQIKLLIIGAGNSNTKSEYEEKLYNEAKNNPNIRFYGKATPDEIVKLYSITNLQIVPSIWEEAFGLIVIEGMCANNQLIVTNSGGIPEIVGESAIIVNRGEKLVDDLSNAIMYAYDNQDIMNKKISNYDEIISKYSLDNYCETFDKYIDM